MIGPDDRRLDDREIQRLGGEEKVDIEDPAALAHHGRHLLRRRAAEGFSPALRVAIRETEQHCHDPAEDRAEQPSRQGLGPLDHTAGEMPRSDADVVIIESVDQGEQRIRRSRGVCIGEDDPLALGLAEAFEDRPPLPDCFGDLDQPKLWQRCLRVAHELRRRIGATVRYNDDLEVALEMFLECRAVQIERTA